jgi:ubiquitin conjugation factor E4 B
MEDPVTLPGSKVTVDRATIQAHLLSDPNDPFNRAPLKIEDVITSMSSILFPWSFSPLTLPDTEVKQQIEDFKAERKAAKLKGADVMDTATG